LDYKLWCQRDLSQKRYVYWWADGVYFNVRLDEERSCVLVLIGAIEDGNKELLAVVDGYRESAQSWRELLGQLKRMGLSIAPKLAMETVLWVSGSLWRKNTAWSPSSVALVHKTLNILDKMPKSVQGKAKQLIHEMYLSPTRKAALAACDQFISSYQTKFPKACECRLRYGILHQLLSVSQSYLDAHDSGKLLNTLSTDTWRVSFAFSVLAGMVINVCIGLS
jgi:putative transposase